MAIYAALWAVALALLLFLAGLITGRRLANRDIVDDVRAYQRGEAVQQLRTLRGWLETETAGLTTQQALLLYDVCMVLGLSEANAQAVVGPAYWLVVDAPVGLETEEVDDV